MGSFFKDEYHYEEWHENRKREYIDLLIEEQLEEIAEIENMDPDQLLEFLHFDKVDFEKYVIECYHFEKSKEPGYD